MNLTESVMLLRKVRAYRPAQQFDDYTGDAWAEALEDIRFCDASEAVKVIGRNSGDFISPHDVLVEVKRIRNTRVAAKESELRPPPWQDQPHYQAWLVESRHRLADGETPEAINADTATSGELLERDVKALIAPLRPIPEPDPVDTADHPVRLQPGPEGPICGDCELRAVRLKPGKWAHASKVDA